MIDALPWKGASFLNDALKAFFVSPGSADADLSGNLDTLERRSRALYQNSSFAGAAVNTKIVNVVGSGLKCRPTLNYALLGLTREQALAWEKKTRNLFDLWAESKDCDAERECNFAQLQDIALKTELICGDAFALRCYTADEHRPFGTCFKILEGNRCRNPEGLNDTEKLAMGVEVDEHGAVIAFHFTTKPIYNLDNYTDSIPTQRVKAWNDCGCRNVIHIFEADRPNQRRGVPWLAPVISQIKQQERYQDAELIAAVVSAFFTVFIKSNNSELAPEFMGNVLDSQRVEDSRLPKSAAELSPGGIVELGSGEDISTANPTRPNANYGTFVDAIFTDIGSRLGISKEVILKQFKSDYNGVRAAILESKKYFDKSRVNLATDFCQPIYDAWLDECVKLGFIDCPGYEDPMKKALWHKCRWIGDAAFMLDPLKETQAIKMQLDEQLTTRHAACSQINGSEYEEIAASLAEELRLREELGLPSPGAVSKSENVSTSTTEVNNGDN